MPVPKPDDLTLTLLSMSRQRLARVGELLTIASKGPTSSVRTECVRAAVRMLEAQQDRNEEEGNANG